MRKKILSFALAFCMMLGMSAFLPEGTFTDSTSISAEATSIKCITRGYHLFSVLVEEKAADCLHDGYKKWKCKDCNETETTMYYALGEHSWQRWQTVIEPTCSHKGVMKRECSVCKCVETQNINEKAHTYGTGPIKTVYPSCTARGYRVLRCTTCGAERTDYFGEPTGHDWGDWTVINAATCEEDGIETQTCKKCGAVERRNISKTGHKWTEWETVRQESCEVGARMERHCERCQKVEGNDFSPIGHYLTDWNTTKEPTCHEAGERERHCRRDGCSYQEKEVLPQLEHWWSAFMVTKKATCTEDGEEERTCSRCGDKETKVIEKTGHKWSDWKETKKATCSADGEKERVCSTCGAKETQKIDKLSHNWSGWTVSKKATCTADGEKYRTCSRCQKKDTVKIEKLGHTPDKNTKAKVVAPTCTAKGYTEYKCARCGQKYKTNYKDATGHAWKDPEWTWSKDRKSAKATFVCKNNSAHTMTLDAKVSVEKTAATCEKKGTIEYIAMVKLNGKILSTVDVKTVAKLGHDWGNPKWNWSKDLKTCKVTFVCSRDKSHTKTITLNSYKKTTPATCASGTKVDTIVSCKIDGKTFTDKKTTTKNDALGHKWTAWKTTKKATCTAAGSQTRTCSVCKKTETKTIAKTGHKFSKWKTTGFNFAKNTSSQTRKCSVCGKTVKQTTKNAITRFAGANRYDTGALISKGMYAKGTDTVIIATGMDYHDALVAVPLASAYKAPLLLATDSQVTKQTEAELARLKAKKVIIVSTNGAVGSKVKAALAKYNPTVISGKTCFETAAKVAKALQAKTKKAPDTIFFATDSAFADALSASPVAAIKNAPIIYLKNTGSIDKATADYLKSVKGKVKNAYIIGGDGVISNAMMKNVATALGLTVNKTVQRVAGANRYETCVAVNNKFKSVLSSDGICVAKGLDFPDALAGGVYAAATKQALFLADGKKLQDCQNSYLKGKNAAKITVFGGTGAVPDELVKLIVKASV